MGSLRIGVVNLCLRRVFACDVNDLQRSQLSATSLQANGGSIAVVRGLASADGGTRSTAHTCAQWLSDQRTGTESETRL